MHRLRAVSGSVPPRRARGHYGPARWTPGRNAVIAVAVVVFAIVCWFTASTLLLFFAGVLLAVFLRSVSDWLRRFLPLSKTWALTLTIVLLLGLATAGGWLLAPEIQKQTQALMTELPQAAAQLQKKLEQSKLGRTVLQASLDIGHTIWRLPAGLGSSLTAAVTGVIVIIFVGIYLAAAPERYVNGFLRLLPAARRPRVQEILSRSGITLQRWLMAQLLLMAINAVVMSVGLLLLGVPMAVTLGIISGLLNFVPNFGPIIAAVPAVLLALVVDPVLAFKVALFYFLYQMFDGYVLTPAIQERKVCLPPALTIMAQVFLGVLLGSMGVTFAIPLLAVMFVVLKMAYVEDVLGERVELPGED